MAPWGPICRNHYSKFYSNFSAKLNVFIPAAIEIHGTIGRRYNTLLKGIAEHAYPNLCGWDIDGLRSRCIAQLRQRVSCGMVRGNHKVLAHWRATAWPAVVPGR